ncbi:MAG: HNH endonuclease [Candidatus Woesearchaeota archaeon]
MEEKNSLFERPMLILDKIVYPDNLLNILKSQLKDWKFITEFLGKPYVRIMVLVDTNEERLDEVTKQIQFMFKKEVESIKFLFIDEEEIKIQLKSVYEQINNGIPEKAFSLDSRLRHEVFKRDNYKCKECGISKEEAVLHCDHIIPVIQGGSDELDNLQILCDKCNFAKSNKCWIGGNNGKLP